MSQQPHAVRRSTSRTASRRLDLTVEDEIVGDGPEATAGSTVVAHYVGVAFSGRRGVRRVVEPR